MIMYTELNIDAELSELNEFFKIVKKEDIISILRDNKDNYLIGIIYEDHRPYDPNREYIRELKNGEENFYWNIE